MTSPICSQTRVRYVRSRLPLRRLGVPTQTSDRSVALTASAVLVVARSRPLPTTSVSSSPRPGSTIGLRPSLMARTFSSLTSTPTTSWPSAANKAAATVPRYPRPKTETFIVSLCCPWGRLRFRKRLDSVAVDECAIPGFEVEQRPDRVAAGARARALVLEELGHGDRIEEAALARTAIEQDLADHVVPRAADPSRERDREAHLRAREDG